MRKKIHHLAAKLALLLIITSSYGQDLPTGVTMEPFYDFTNSSVADANIKTIWMEEVPGMHQHFWVLDQYGLIYALYPDGYDPNSLVPYTGTNYNLTELTDFSDRVIGNIQAEYGAWSVAFHNNFEENGKFYILYIGRRPGQTSNFGGLTTVDEWTASGDNFTTLTRERTIWTYDHGNAYGVACMTMGPDGYLYIANGDYLAYSWDLTTFGRKFLRIDIDNKEDGKEYAIPPDNPYVNSTDTDIKKEIYAYGFRNVWGLKHDAITGDLWAGSIGQHVYEELEMIKKGANHGWNQGAGSAPPQGYPWGDGFMGPCGEGSLETSSDSVPRNCEDFEEPHWSFPRNNNVISGSLNDESNYISMASIFAGNSFMGAKDSPFYGYHIFGDTHDSQLYATLPANRAEYEVDNTGVATITGERPRLIGQAHESISRNNDGHDGLVYIGRDSFGFLYGVFLSWQVDQDWREIYRMSHPQMTPAVGACTDDRYANYDPTSRLSDPSKCVGLKVEYMNAENSSGFSGMFINMGGIVDVKIPPTAVQINLFDLKGKVLWQGSRDGFLRETRSGTSRLPKGIFRILPVYQ